MPIICFISSGKLKPTGIGCKKCSVFPFESDFMLLASADSAQTVSGILLFFLMRTVNIGIECSEFEMKDNKKMLSRREVHHQHGYPYCSLWSRCMHMNHIAICSHVFRFLLMRKKSSNHIHSVHGLHSYHRYGAAPCGRGCLFWIFPIRGKIKYRVF